MALVILVPTPALVPTVFHEGGTIPSGGGLGGIVAPNLALNVAATAALGSFVGSHGANQFWGIEMTDDATPTRVLTLAGAYLNTTPISWFRFGGDGAAYDPTTQTLYNPPASGSGTLVPAPTLLWNLTWFKSYCLSRPTCHWLMSLPGEENDTAAAVHYATWFHSVLGLAPTRWEFGNEPSQWTDYGVNLTRWSTSAFLKPSAAAYATMVGDYARAVAAHFPRDAFVGLEAACACNKLLAEDTGASDYPLLAGMAYHSYPTIPGSNTSLNQFYGVLRSSANLTASALKFRSSVELNCAACGRLPIDLGEYQAGPFHAFSPFIQTYAGAPWLAASIIQALDANLSSFTLFDWNTLYNASASNVTWEGKLYQRLLPNLTMGKDFAVNVNAPGVGGVTSILVKNGTHESLLVVNTNTTYSLSLALTSALFPVGLTGSSWSWHPGQALPTVQRNLLLPTSYAIPAQGILLLDNY